MADVLFVADAVITGEQLRRLHKGQRAVCFAPRTVLTPTAWDYVREARLDVSRGEAAAGADPATPPPAPRARDAAPAAGAAQAAPTHGLIAEVAPAQLVAQGRCDYPDRACGCKTDEFGSGYADGLAVAGDLEALVQRITDLVMDELRAHRP